MARNQVGSSGPGSRVRFPVCDDQIGEVVFQNEFSWMLSCEMFHEEGGEVGCMRSGVAKTVVLGGAEGEIVGNKVSIPTWTMTQITWRVLRGEEEGNEAVMSACVSSTRGT